MCKDSRWPAQIGRMAGAGMVVALLGCDSAGTSTEPNEQIAIRINPAAVTLQPGATTTVVVSVAPRHGAVKLSVATLPAGVTAWFTPEVLDKADTQSTLRLIAAVTAPPGGTSATVRASVVSGADSFATDAQTASLAVTVTCLGYADPSRCPPFPTGGSNVVNGHVLKQTATGVVPFPYASVWAWVQTPNSGYSRGRTVAAADGSYAIDQLPSETILLQAAAQGFDQPCGAVFNHTGSSMTVDLTLVPQESPFFDERPPAPAIVATVYETTATGRTPVSGARIFATTGLDLVTATTTSDGEGRFSMCRMNSFEPNHLITAMKAGYETSSVLVPISDMMRFDIELKRQ